MAKKTNYLEKAREFTGRMATANPTLNIQEILNRWNTSKWKNLTRPREKSGKKNMKIASANGGMRLIFGQYQKPNSDKTEQEVIIKAQASKARYKESKTHTYGPKFKIRTHKLVGKTLDSIERGVKNMKLKFKTGFKKVHIAVKVKDGSKSTKTYHKSTKLRTRLPIAIMLTYIQAMYDEILYDYDIEDDEVVDIMAIITEAK